MATVNSDLYAEAPVVRARMSVSPEAIDALLDATCLEEPAPGSYQIAFLDALAAIKPEDIVKRGKVKVIEKTA